MDFWNAAFTKITGKHRLSTSLHAIHQMLCQSHDCGMMAWFDIPSCLTLHYSNVSRQSRCAASNLKTHLTLLVMVPLLKVRVRSMRHLQQTQAQFQQYLFITSVTICI